MPRRMIAGSDGVTDGMLVSPSLPSIHMLHYNPGWPFLQMYTLRKERKIIFLLILLTLNVWAFSIPTTNPSDSN
jgi:hypothetical protein